MTQRPTEHTRTMPFHRGSKQYCQVPNNDFDLRIPLHSEESFQHGILFQAKVSFLLYILFDYIRTAVDVMQMFLFLFGHNIPRWEFPNSFAARGGFINKHTLARRGEGDVWWVSVTSLPTGRLQSRWLSWQLRRGEKRATHSVAHTHTNLQR